MSEQQRRRIRAQPSGQDRNAMAFILDAPVQDKASAKLERSDRAPLAQALFAIEGVARVEVADATIWIVKTPESDWTALKPAIAASIRAVLAETATPLGQMGNAQDADPDVVLLRKVGELLEREVNPTVAAHGGHIAAEKVSEGIVFLRMSGGCQGCAASAATLRQGVERMLRAALPQISEIRDVTDHAAGTRPYFSAREGTSPLLDRPLPPGAVTWQGGQILVDPEYLAPRLGLTAQTLRAGLHTGDIVSVTESGAGADAGKTRIILRSPTRAWAAEIDADGRAREVPPPRVTQDASANERALAARVRAHLQALPENSPTVTYGAIARALGLWVPGSIRKVTRALEVTMREDAEAQRPFIAARAVSKRQAGLPAEGFFALARTLSRGPEPAESAKDFHARELRRLSQVSAKTGVELS